MYKTSSGVAGANEGWSASGCSLEQYDDLTNKLDDHKAFAHNGALLEIDAGGSWTSAVVPLRQRWSSGGGSGIYPDNVELSFMARSPGGTSSDLEIELIPYSGSTSLSGPTPLTATVDSWQEHRADFTVPSSADGVQFRVWVVGGPPVQFDSPAVYQSIQTTGYPGYSCP